MSCELVLYEHELLHFGHVVLVNHVIDARYCNKIYLQIYLQIKSPYQNADETQYLNIVLHIFIYNIYSN